VGSRALQLGPVSEPATRKKRSWRRLAIELAVVLAVFLAFRAWQTRDAADGPAPALAGSGLDGSALALATDRPTLVHFWATWCGVCRAEQGTIDALAGDHHVVTVASQSGGAPEVQAYLEREGVDFPVIVDPGGALAARWGVHAFPTTFVVAPDGTISDVEVGYTTSLGLRARLWLASL